MIEINKKAKPPPEIANENFEALWAWWEAGGRVQWAYKNAHAPVWRSYNDMNRNQVNRHIFLQHYGQFQLRRRPAE